MSSKQPVSDMTADAEFLEDRNIPLDPKFLPARCREMLGYWQSCARVTGREIPRRKDIDPADLVQFLPWLALVDVVGKSEPYDFRIRVLGAGLVENVGDYTGLLVSETPLMKRDRRFIQRIVAEKRAFCHMGRLWLSQKVHYRFFELTLPLGNEEDRVDKVLVFFELQSDSF